VATQACRWRRTRRWRTNSIRARNAGFVDALAAELGSNRRAGLALPTHGFEVARTVCAETCEPPKSDATCLVHLNGVSNATAKPAAMCG
jgi:hypothetical protein